LVSIKTLKKYLVFLGSFVILAGCSVEKNTDASRFYNSMTARYNIYFNGYENYKAGLAKISNNYQDDFARTLNVFEFSDPSIPSLCSTDMERAIQKASKLIALKSITARPEIKNTRELSAKEKTLTEMKEYNEWVDDSYLLIGKARFYKHEFPEAASLFDYCITNANDPDIKTEATIWLARVNNETRKFNESSRILTGLEIDEKTDKTLKAMYYTTIADMYVRQKNYSEAIDPINKALEIISGKRTRYRLTFLLAQLYGSQGNGSLATSNFQKVIRMRPPYDVEFYARINIAGVFDVNSMNPAKMKKELEKMLKDSKNVDFQDQIYYALGNMAMKEGKEEEAIGYYHKSATAISQNQNQRGRSFLALASYYFNKPDFIRSGMYYDSTVYFLDPAFPEFSEIQEKSQNLNALVSQLNIIQREDSLQKIAKMNESQRNSIIAGLIAQATKEETDRKSTDYTDRNNLGQFYENERRSQGNIEQEGKWYFYNQSALAFGRTEFRRRWGDRRLEDNWRRSNKTRVSTQQFGGTDDTENLAGNDTAAALSDYKKPEFYLKDLPLTDSLLAISDDKVATAMMNSGKAFAERLLDEPRATEAYEALIKRYPTSDLVPEALYNLYRINKQSNGARSEVYRQQLLQLYPESEYARILSDPEYYEKKMAEIRQAEARYDQAYIAYSEERFNEAISICADALQKYPQNQLAPKFQLLRAFSVAKTSDERSFRNELTAITKSWPKTDESRKAAEMLAYLDQKSPELKVEVEKEVAKELYKKDTTVAHLFALVILDPKFNINQATFDVISYNIDNYTNNNYRTEGSLAANKYLIITVAGFRNYSQALEYYKNFSVEKNVRNQSGKKMLTFIINNENLKILNGDGNPERYQLFFMENYLK
jgi:predicted negative regulator of RcsB-dependent stress response